MVKIVFDTREGEVGSLYINVLEPVNVTDCKIWYVY